MKAAVLALEAVTFTYPSGRPGLVDFSLEVGPGEWVALMGANGSGKSTALRMAAGLLRPERGEVNSAGGVYVAQDPEANIIGERVEDDVAFGPLQRGLGPQSARELARACLRAVGMEWASSRSFLHLSGGEIQRVALAAALATGKPLLILDEPTSHLPAAESRRFFHALKRAVEEGGVSVLYATHSAAEAAYAHRVIVMVEGRVAVEGPPRRVVRCARLLDALGVDPTACEAAAAWCERMGTPVPWPATGKGLVEAVCSLFER